MTTTNDSANNTSTSTTSLPTPLNPHTHLQYHCLTHSTGLSPTSHVTLAIRKLYCSLTSVPNHQQQSLHYGAQYKILITLTELAGLPRHLLPRSTTESTPLVRSEESCTGQISPRMSLTHSCTWDEKEEDHKTKNVLTLPVRYKDLSRDAGIKCQVVDSRGHVVAEAVCGLWDDLGRLKMGLETVPLVFSEKDHDGDDANEHEADLVEEEDETDEHWEACQILDQLEQWEQRKQRQISKTSTNAKTTPTASPLGLRSSLASRRFKGGGSGTNTTPSKRNSSTVEGSIGTSHVPSSLAGGGGETPGASWLDSMTRERCLEILQEPKDGIVDTSQERTNRRQQQQHHHHHWKNHYPPHHVPHTSSPHPTRNKAYLILELPSCELPVLHEENLYNSAVHGASGSVQALELSLYHHEKQRILQSQRDTTNKESTMSSSYEDYDEPLFLPMPNPLHPQDELPKLGLGLVQVLDQESPNDNPVEDKYRTLQHHLLRGLVDPALKPNLVEKSRLNVIIGGTSQHLTVEEKDLLWKFRFSLVDNRQALTKFLLAVDWTVESEVVQAAELLEQWRKRSPIEVTDALKLLGKNVAFQTGLVRTYAISTLAEAPDGELVLYLLQLVQALRYDHVSNDNSKQRQKFDCKSSLGAFLIDRASKSMELANYLYWYLKVETEDAQYGQTFRNVFKALEEKLSQTPVKVDSTPTQHLQYTGVFESVSKLGSSLSEKAGGKAKFSTRSMWDILSAQDAFISSLMDFQQASRDARGKKDAKEQHLREQLKSNACSTINNGWAVPLPTAPDIQVTGVEASTARMFKSALYPALLEFIIHSGNKKEQDTFEPHKDEVYKVIVKTGDDLRQDQLVISLIKLMDRILKRGALDLCLKPYNILATGPTSGLVEFVQNSAPISHILNTNNNSILNYFKKNAPCEGAPYGVNPDVMQTYIRSCAGYCVITYLIGVGDRHKDNIMIQQNGHFFHIDFGFIFGRDPKPFPPALRITREMVDGMGGFDSPGYNQFCSHACQAFNLLRKSAGLVLNLLHLMSDAGIEDLSNNPEGVIEKVEERFQLELTDEQAESYFLRIMNESLGAFVPKITDFIHELAVARR